MDNIQYTDAICESINIIAQSLVDGIQCDKTIICTIVDNSLKEQGQYLVTDGKTKFNAYSEDTSYRNNTVVYVTIPNGDFTEQKIITGKKVTSSNPFVYKSPFDDMFAISSNLASQVKEQGLIANQQKKELGFFKTNDFWNCGTNGDNLIFTNNPQPSKIFNNSDMYDVLWSLPFCYNEKEHPGGYLAIPSIGINWSKLKNKETVILYCRAIKDLKGGTIAFDGYLNEKEIPIENTFGIFELHINAMADDFDTDYYTIDCQIENWREFEEKKVLILDKETIPIIETKNCDRMGLKANFRTSLTNLKAIEGIYGLELVIKTEKEVETGKYVSVGSNPVYDYKQTYYAPIKKENDEIIGYSTIALTKDTINENYLVKETELKYQEYIFDLNIKDMIGNPYMFDGYFSQEKVFDISDIGKVVNAKLYFYENNKFYDKDKNYISAQENPNIFVKDIEIYFGKDISSIENESIKLICYNDDDIYKARSNKLGNMKRIQLQWFHREGDQISLIDKDNIDELYLESLSEAEDAVNNDKLVETDLFEMRLETKEKKHDRVYFTREIVGDKKTHKKVFYLNTSEPYQKYRRYFKKGYWQNEDNTIPEDNLITIEGKKYIRTIEDVTTEMPISNVEYVIDFGNGSYEYVGYIDNFEKDFTYKEYTYKEADNGTYVFGYKEEQDITSNTPLDELYNLYYIDYEYSKDENGDCGVIYNTATEGNDELYYIYMKPENLSINWYHLKPGTDNADEYGGPDWDPIPDFSEENALQTHVEDKFICEFYPDAEYNETEQIKAVLLYEGQPYYSEIMTFSNQDEVIKTRTLDYETGLSISFEDKTKGNYYIYDESNYLIDRSQANRDRKLVLKYGGANLVHADEVIWIIPTENTMIEVPGVTGGRKVIADSSLNEYSLNYRIKNYYSYENVNNTIICQIKKNGQSFIATANLSFGQNGSSGSEYTLVLELLEKDQVVVYNPTRYKVSFEEAAAEEGTYNQISDNIYEKNAKGNYNMTYVIDNSKGNYYKYNDNYIPYNENIKVQALLYDQNHNLITLDNSIKIEWKVLNNIIQDKSSEIIEISRNLIGQYGTIVSANLTYKGNNLTSYLPIPVKSKDSEAVIYQGPTQIIYDSFGTASYYKDPIKLFNSSNEEIDYKQAITGKTTLEIDSTGITQSFTNKQEELSDKNLLLLDENLSDEKKQEIKKIKIKWSGFPQIENSGLVAKSFYLVANSFYIENLFDEKQNLNIIIYDSNNNIIWSQPILYLQSRYFSSTINKWDGSLSIGEDQKDTILAKMIGAGSKDSNGYFSGVIIGDWSGEISGLDNRKSLGLYGFNAGDASFGFCVDGTAFIGKAGSGQIIFDGNSGEIKSSKWNGIKYDKWGKLIIDNNIAEGMHLDLDDGQFSLIGKYGNDSYGFLTINNDSGKAFIGNTEYDNNDDDETNNIEEAAINANNALFIYWDGTLTVGNRREEFKEFSDVTSSDVGVKIDPSGKMRAWNADFGYCNISNCSVNSLTVKKFDDNSNLGTLGYIQGNDGTKNTNCVGISSENSIVFKTKQNIRLSADENIYIDINNDNKTLKKYIKEIINEEYIKEIINEEYIKDIIDDKYIKITISAEYATKDWVENTFGGGTIGGTPVTGF